VKTKERVTGGARCGLGVGSGFVDSTFSCFRRAGSGRSRLELFGPLPFHEGDRGPTTVGQSEIRVGYHVAGWTNMSSGFLES